jgi:hypothetical protein
MYAAGTTNGRSQRRFSKYRGLFWCKQIKTRWAVKIRYDGKNHHIGYFDDEEQAARAYDTAARVRQGSRAILNFPPGGDQGVQQKASKYRGVSWCNAHKNWVVHIGYDGKRHHIGSFDDEHDAAGAYDRVATAQHGSRAMLNFHASPCDESKEGEADEDGGYL